MPVGLTAPTSPALMNIAQKPTFVLNQRHLLGIEGLSREEIVGLLDRAEEFVELNRQIEKKQGTLRGRTQINLFFEVSTRTQSSFEIAGKRLGADVMNMSVSSSSMRKGETLIDTAVTLNAMHPDILVVRHHASGAVELLARKVDGSVINAGDGAHEHPTQGLLDLYTIRERFGKIEGLKVAIVGDIANSRVVRSNLSGGSAAKCKRSVPINSAFASPIFCGAMSRNNIDCPSRIRLRSNFSRRSRRHRLFPRTKSLCSRIF